MVRRRSEQPSILSRIFCGEPLHTIGERSDAVLQTAMGKCSSPKRNGRDKPGHSFQLLFKRSHRGVDPLLKLLLRRGANLTSDHLAVLEDHQYRDRHYPILRCDSALLVDVDLA